MKPLLCLGPIKKYKESVKDCLLFRPMIPAFSRQAKGKRTRGKIKVLSLFVLHMPSKG